MYLHGEPASCSATRRRTRRVLEAAGPRDRRTTGDHASSTRSPLVGRGLKQIEQVPSHAGPRKLVSFSPDGDSHGALLPRFSQAATRRCSSDRVQRSPNGGPRRWGEPIVTKLVRGDDAGPFAVDTLTIPYKNRFNALFFCTGLDFLPDGRIAVCTCHGDVWLVTVDEKAATCSLAALRHRPVPAARPEGRGRQGRRPGDAANSRGCTTSTTTARPTSTSASATTGTPAAASTPTTPASKPTRDGNFYFFKTGDTDTPHRRLPDEGVEGRQEGRGVRHRLPPPDRHGDVADRHPHRRPTRKGTGCRRTRIDEYKKGGFYGDMRGAPPQRRRRRPTTRRCAGCRGRWTTPPAGRCGCRRARSVRSRACRCTSPTAGASRSCCSARNAATASSQGGVAALGREVPLRRLPRAVRPATGTCTSAASTAGRPRRRRTAACSASATPASRSTCR